MTWRFTSLVGTKNHQSWLKFFHLSGSAKIGLDPWLVLVFSWDFLTTTKIKEYHQLLSAFWAGVSETLSLDDYIYVMYIVPLFLIGALKGYFLFLLLLAADKWTETKSLHWPRPNAWEHTHCIWMPLLLTSGMFRDSLHECVFFFPFFICG